VAGRAGRSRSAMTMHLDDLALALQRAIDRFVRRLRRGSAPERTHRRLLIVQIDGLSRVVLERGLASGYMPFLKRLLRHGYRLEPMTVGLPTSTPAFQIAAMYGVRPDIPGFHYFDRNAAGRRPLPKPRPRRAGRGQAGGGPPRHRARRQHLRLCLYRRRRQQPVQLREPHAALGPRAARRTLPPSSWWPGCA